MNAFDLTLNATEFPLHTPADSFKVKVSGTDAGEAADTLNAGKSRLIKMIWREKKKISSYPISFSDSFSYIRPPSHKNTLLSLILFYEKGCLRNSNR